MTDTGGERPLKILVITNLFPSRAQPAFGTFVAARVDALVRAGQQVRLVAVTDPGVHRRVFRKYFSLAVRAFSVAIRARLARRRFDIIEAHIAFPTGLVALPAALLGGGRVVVFAHGVDVRELAWRSWMATTLARLLFRRVDLVVANSAFTAAQVRRLGPLKRTPAVISPGVVLPASNKFAPESLRAGILYVGRLIPEKGVRELMSAVAALGSPRPHLTVVGDGPLKAEVEALASKLSIGVSFLGPLPPIDVAREMQRAAIVAVPSIYEEPLGLVPIEAMAYGAIVVASRTGGLAETVDDGRNGITTAPGDVPGLTAALQRALEVLGTPAAETLRAGALETARLHDIDRSVALTVAAYRQLQRPG